MDHVDVAGLIPNLSDIVHISSRGHVTYALDNKGVAYLWGPGTHYQLTDRDGDDHWVPLRMTGRQLEGRKVVRLGVGGQHGAMILCPRQ